MRESISEVLKLESVSRIYPRDISDTPSNILREMFLPKAALSNSGEDVFFVLKDINLTLNRGECLGVLGVHQSGKSTLAGIASGVLLPTAGTVKTKCSRTLISRPTAGFKPTLSVIENLSFRVALAGVSHLKTSEIIEVVLSCCNISKDEARKPIGNLSPYIVKQLGLTLLLELPADILVVDDISSAGTGDARWETRGRLQDKIEQSTALVLSEDSNFIKEITDSCMLLHGSKLYGPFEVEEAVDLYNQLPTLEAEPSNKNYIYDPMKPPVFLEALKYQQNSDVDHTYDQENIEFSSDDRYEAISGKKNDPPWKALNIVVDGEDFIHSKYSLVRQPNETIHVSIEMLSHRKQLFNGGVYFLHGGNSGIEIGSHEKFIDNMIVEMGEKYFMNFDFVIPESNEDFYGLTYCPRYIENQYPKEHRIKILIFGVGKKQYKHEWLNLEVINNSFNRKVEKDGSIDTE